MSPTGADHCHNVHDTAYTDRIPGSLSPFGVFQPMPNDELSPAKIRILVYGSLWQHVLDCLVFCQFIPLRPGQIADLVRGVTGWDTSLWELMKVGERCINLDRAFNVREWMGRNEDYLPGRFFTPFTSGPLNGVNIDDGEMSQAIDTYCAMVGWDSDGVPTLTKLQELGIEWVSYLFS